jgi:lysophospholipase L1-like esterase
MLQYYAVNVNRKVVIPAAIVLGLLVWLLFPSKYSRVRNLASHGSNIIAFGDSLTAGYGANPGEDYPAGLAKLIGRDIINAGVSGDTTDTALDRIDADVLQRDPRIVIIGLGGNDFLRGSTVESAEANLRTIVQRIHASGAMVVLLGFNFPSLTANWGKMYKRVAAAEGCLLIPDLLDGIIGNPSLKSDEIHPNAQGYALMAERVAGPVKKLITKADATR